VTLFSCEKDEPKTQEDCGCDSKTVRQVYRMSASYSGGNIFTFLDLEITGSTPNIANLCDSSVVNPTWQKDRANYNFLISGQLKSMCGQGDYIPLLPSFMFTPSKIEEL
jgi:hypothetical protein